MNGLITALVYSNAASTFIKDAPSASFYVVQGIFASDHVGSPAKKRDSFELVSSNNGPKSGIFVVNMLLLLD